MNQQEINFEIHEKKCLFTDKMLDFSKIIRDNCYIQLLYVCSPFFENSSEKKIKISISMDNHQKTNINFTNIIYYDEVMCYIPDQSQSILVIGKSFTIISNTNKVLCGRLKIKTNNTIIHKVLNTKIEILNKNIVNKICCVEKIIINDISIKYRDEYLDKRYLSFKNVLMSIKNIYVREESCNMLSDIFLVKNKGYLTPPFQTPILFHTNLKILNGKLGYALKKSFFPRTHDDLYFSIDYHKSDKIDILIELGNL